MNPPHLPQAFPNRKFAMLKAQRRLQKRTGVDLGHREQPGGSKADLRLVAMYSIAKGLVIFFLTLQLLLVIDLMESFSSSFQELKGTKTSNEEFRSWHAHKSVVRSQLTPNDVSKSRCRKGCWSIMKIKMGVAYTHHLTRKESSGRVTDFGTCLLLTVYH